MTTKAAARAARPTRSGRSAGWVPFALVALILLPAFFGSLRLVGLAGGPQLWSCASPKHRQLRRTHDHQPGRDAVWPPVTTLSC